MVTRTLDFYVSGCILDGYLKTSRKTRAIAVQLTPQTVKRLDELAARSKMSRHRYMILVLERAVKNSVVLREEIAFSDE